MRKIFVLDTSVLIFDPCVYKQFSNSDVIIPIAVLNELDKLKKQPGEVGKNARVAIRALDELSNKGDISTGILIDNDIMVKVDATYYDILNNPEFAGFGDPNYGDTQILACAVSVLKFNHGDYVSLVSNDINLRIKAKSRSLEAQSCEDNKPAINELYSGIQIINNEEVGVDLQHGIIDPTAYGYDLHPNECVLFTDNSNNNIALGRKIEDDQLKLIKKFYPWGIASKNKEQSFAIDLIMDSNVDLVTMTGISGTGKSIIALACALELVLNKKEYEQLIIYRPIEPMGNAVGFLPGLLSEKLEPWFQAIMDSFEVLFSTKNGKWRRNLLTYQESGQIQMDALTYIRGRSIPNSIILVDETQNLSHEEVKTILTRAGENTKIILTGDISQIDSNRLDATNNGLTYVIEKFKNSPLAGHITFTQGERSRLATAAAEIL